MQSDIAGRAIQIGRFIGSPTIVNLTVASANLQLSEYKKYRLWSSVNAFFLFGIDNTVTATTSSHPLQAGLDALAFTDKDNIWLAAVVPSGTGALYISQLDTDTA
jgi:hypothetical protein